MTLRRLSTSTDVFPLSGAAASSCWLQFRHLKYDPYAGLKRPTQSPAMRKRDEQILFPKTLKSGRYEHQGTVQQKIYKGPGEATEGARTADARFFRKAQDYREVQDNDPYAGVFGESAATVKTRVRTWQKQFEDENADVELPYERTSALKRAAPNWFVRYFVDLRDRGGTNSLMHLVLFGTALMMLLTWVSYIFYVAPKDSKPTMEIR